MTPRVPEESLMPRWGWGIVAALVVGLLAVIAAVLWTAAAGWLNVFAPMREP